LLPENEDNLVLLAMQHLARYAGQPLPPVHVLQHNAIPVGSGLGSSAAAVTAGLLAAGALLDTELPAPLLLALATELEGHADNVAAALYGGLVLVAGEEVVPLPVAPLQAVVVLPAITLSTQAARAALPESVPRADAVFNLGQMGLLLQALAQGDHDPCWRGPWPTGCTSPTGCRSFRGWQAALEAAHAAGAAACLSGAGPSLIAFTSTGHEELAEKMSGGLRHCRRCQPVLDGERRRTWRQPYGVLRAGTHAAALRFLASH
jgi:homoserine kinase